VQSPVHRTRESVKVELKSLVSITIMEEDSYQPETPLLISNIQVMDILSEKLEARGSDQRKRTNRFRNRNWIEENVHAYLKATPCVLLDKSRRQELQTALQSSKQGIIGSESARQGFNLTEAESLQILNFMPTEPVEIHLMIEELHARMSEKEQDELLEMVGTYKVGTESGDSKPTVTVVKTEEEDNGHAMI